MSAFTLGLRRATVGDDAASVDALLVLDADVARLLALVLELGDDATCHALATSVADPTAAGFLVVFAASRLLDSVGHHPGRVALRRVGGALFVPRDAELWPPVGDDELTQLVAGQVALLLPGGRYFTFAPSDAARLVDLVELPAPRAVDWGRARPGTRIATELVSVMAPPFEREDELFGGADDEIGALPLSELPKSVTAGGPRRSKLAGAVRSGLSWIAAKLARSGSQNPSQGPDAGRFLARLLEWADARATADLTAEREREIERLLKLMEQDPAEGLRYALPLTGHGARGVAPPSARLGTRTVEFDRRGLERSTPADDWRLDPALRQTLWRRYHEHARLESELGRHRRAAYVYAHLLGDFTAAARALAQGRHHREAAALWRDKLNQPIQAAQVLREGGFDEEALELFRSLRMWQLAAELLEKLGRRTEARETWRAHAYEREEIGDHLGAADVLERHVGAPEEALAVLERGFAAAPLLRDTRLRWLALSGQLSRTAEARRWLEQRSSAQLGATELRDLAQILHALAGGACAGAHEAFASDRLRLLIGRVLAERRPQDVDLLELLAEPRPSDPLFNRDRRRFGVELARRAPKLAKASSIELQRAFTIGNVDAERTSFDVVGALLFVVRPFGATERPRVSCYSAETGRCLGHAELEDAPPLTARPWCVVSKFDRSYGVLIGRSEACHRWVVLTCTLADGSARFERAGIYPMYPGQVVLAIARVDETRTRLLVADLEEEHLFLQDTAAPARATDPVQTTIVDAVFHGSEATYAPPRLAVLEGCTVLSGIDTRAWKAQPGLSSIHADAPIERLLSRSPHDPWLVFTTARGVGVRSAAVPDGQTVLWCSLPGLEHGPGAVVLPAGFLVASDGAALVVVRMSLTEVRLEHRGAAPSSSLVALAPMPRSDEFGWLDREGLVRVYRLGGF